MKAWALMLVVALAVFGWGVFASAAKVQLTDLELDGVSGGDSSAATSQAGLGSGSANASSNGISGPDSASASAVVSSPGLPGASASGSNATTTTTAGDNFATATAGAGQNHNNAGNKKTKESVKNTITPGTTKIGVHNK